jgi:hypothetical protein
MARADWDQTIRATPCGGHEGNMRLGMKAPPASRARETGAGGESWPAYPCGMSRCVSTTTPGMPGVVAA